VRITVTTLDEREAMALREQGWKIHSMQSSEWVLTWPKKGWPPFPVTMNVPERDGSE
jgi:hypothetical protein